MRDELGVQHMGFDPDEIAAWLGDAGFRDVRVDVHPAATRGADLPETFLAHAHAPESTT